jgi:hypothetical protein
MATELEFPIIQEDLYKMIKESGEEVVDVREGSSGMSFIKKLNFSFSIFHKKC